MANVNDIQQTRAIRNINMDRLETLVGATAREYDFDGNETNEDEGQDTTIRGYAAQREELIKNLQDAQAVTERRMEQVDVLQREIDKYRRGKRDGEALSRQDFGEGIARLERKVKEDFCTAWEIPLWALDPRRVREAEKGFDEQANISEELANLRIRLEDKNKSEAH